MLAEFAVAGVAALPFLPHGKGAVILILGGLAILPAALLWSRAAAGTQRWTLGIEPGAQRAGLGACQVLTADLRSCVVVLRACPACRPGASRHAAKACTQEQAALAATVRPRAPGARVTEVVCNRSGRGSCVFVIHRGASP